MLYQHFAQRDAQIIEFAARAGSPPTAATLLRWNAGGGGPRDPDQWSRSWESWAGELIESHSTYPMLAFYRSQHDGHSWLASLAVVLDACTLILAGSESGQSLQAAATYYAARRVLNEVSSSRGIATAPNDDDERLSSQDFMRLTITLESSIPGWRNAPDTAGLTKTLRRAYEPQLAGLSKYLWLPLPSWAPTAPPSSTYLTRDEIVRQLVQVTHRSE